MATERRRGRASDDDAAEPSAEETRGSGGRRRGGRTSAGRASDAAASETRVGDGGASAEPQPVGPGGAEPEDADEPQDAARLALSRARDAARAKKLVPGRPGPRRRTAPGAGHAPEVVHGAGRDPQLLGGTMDRLAAQLGWGQSLQVGGVVGRWREVVGDRVADHCVPETFTDGALVVRADSTAWATQIRLLLPQLERRIAEEVGEGVVTSIQVLGPGGPSWRKGPRSVQGRGPRDTYG